ncbi:hypothetical protein TNCT_333051 [Trichonephila clavata]|uniref:Uncharacterized protein n=1 Tax=Trichonephila clavata TaxID=2740835 RepID=A0A8X6G2H3_TRICU|nr:hypothetical protein TNCT_333051 [Trichonephila clavata]
MRESVSLCVSPPSLASHSIVFKHSRKLAWEGRTQGREGQRAQVQNRSVNRFKLRYWAQGRKGRALMSVPSQMLKGLGTRFKGVYRASRTHNIRLRLKKNAI